MPFLSSSVFFRCGRLLLLLGAVSILQSCSTTQSNTQSDKRLAAEIEMDKMIAAQPQPSEVPPAVSQALLSTSTQLNSTPRNTSERFDVSVRDVPAREFFLGLVSGTHTNIVVHPDVKGTISLNLKNVSIGDVLRVTRDIYGYEFKRDRGIYTIYANALRTEVFHVNYLDVQRVGVSDTSVMIGRAPASNSGNSNGYGNNTANDMGDTSNLLGMLGGEEQNGSSTGLTPGSRVQTLNRTDFWNSLRSTIAAMIGGETENRMVVVTPQAGMIAVKALPHELSAVREFLERSELSVKRQVVLEAKILEVQLSEGFEAGVNWDAISGQLGYAYNQGRDTLTTDEVGVNLNDSNVLDPFGSFSDSIMHSSDGLFSSLIQVTDITELLSLLETQGDVQVLSSPRVSTVNNQKAVIRVGSDEYFVTGISNNTTANVSSVTSTPNIELSPFFSGISLDVTPQISENGDVILHIHPVVSDVQDQQKSFTVGDEDFSLPLALRGIRESDSIVRATNGQVIVLGGLMQETVNNEDGKRPGLGDVPLVKYLFKTKRKSRIKTELVILLRPTVVDDSTWDEQISESQLRMQQMGNLYRAQ